mmetsp:Transcript_2756/g.5707  ORF Transcript_2756/g.5707 Transcript_2756/m.5707 type:complete len:119 (+) Transcript_2756:177-533(+)
MVKKNEKESLGDRRKHRKEAAGKTSEAQAVKQRDSKKAAVQKFMEKQFISKFAPKRSEEKRVKKKLQFSAASLKQFDPRQKDHTEENLAAVRQAKAKKSKTKAELESIQEKMMKSMKR